MFIAPLQLSILTPPQMFSGDPPFEDASSWLSLRIDVVKNAKRPPKPQTLLEPQADIDRGLANTIWSVIEDCWSQEPSDRPTAETVSLRLRDVNGCSVKPVIVQPHTAPKQVQDRNISIDKEHSTTERAGGISTPNQTNEVPRYRPKQRAAWKNRNLVIKTGDNVMVGGRSTDIVIPCDSIHRFLKKISLPLLSVMGPTGVGKSTVCQCFS